MKKDNLAGYLIAAAILLPIHCAQADGFEVRPITVETSDGLALVVVTNPGDRRVYLESHVLDWSQNAAGAEFLAESDTAIASPPAMWVPPHSSYTMRIKLPAARADTERAFRVVLKQLPDRSELAAGRVVFALTQNLPAFVAPANPSPPAITARMLDPRHVVIENGGGRRIRITNVSQDGAVLASGLVGYSLAQGALAIALPRPIHAGTLDVETDLGRRTVAVR